MFIDDQQRIHISEVYYITDAHCVLQDGVSRKSTRVINNSHFWTNHHKNNKNFIEFDAVIGGRTHMPLLIPLCNTTNYGEVNSRGTMQVTLKSWFHIEVIPLKNQGV